MEDAGLLPPTIRDGFRLDPLQFQELDALAEMRREAKRRGDAAAERRASTAMVAVLERTADIRIADDKLQGNELLKLRANYLNGIAVASRSVGVLTPVLGLFAPGSPYAGRLSLLGAAAAGCFALSVTTHTMGLRSLRRLRA